MYQRGQARAIGISNFNEAHTEDILSVAQVAGVFVGADILVFEILTF